MGDLSHGAISFLLSVEISPDKAGGIVAYCERALQMCGLGTHLCVQELTLLQWHYPNQWSLFQDVHWSSRVFVTHCLSRISREGYSKALC